MARGLYGNGAVDVDKLCDDLVEHARKTFGEYGSRKFWATTETGAATIAGLFGTLAQRGLFEIGEAAAVFVAGGTYDLVVYRMPTGRDGNYVINVDVVLKTWKINVDSEGLSFEDGMRINFAMRFHDTYGKAFGIVLDTPQDKDMSLGQVAEEVIKGLRL